MREALVDGLMLSVHGFHMGCSTSRDSRVADDGRAYSLG